MTNPQNNNNNLYESLANAIKENPKNMKVKAKAKAKAKAQVKVPATATPTAQAKAVVVSDKETLITRILKYQASRRFGHVITKELKINYNREQLTKFSIDRLEKILKRIRTHLNSRNMDAMFEQLAITCANGYERTISPFYDITGFSDLLLANPGFHDALERYKIERELPDVPPGLQLAYIVASTTLTAHALNIQQLSNVKPNKQDTTKKPNKNDDIIIKDRDELKIGKQI